MLRRFGKGSRQRDARAIRWRANLILGAIALSVLTGLLGYFTLQRTSEFNRRNFVHLASAEQGRSVVPFVQTPDDAQGVAYFLETAIAQARWCIASSNTLERVLLRALDADLAMQICAADLRSGARGRESIAAFADGRIGPHTFRDEMTAVFRDMAAYSSAFAPHVARVERIVAAGVTTATALLGIGLMALVWRANRTTLGLWDAVARERVRFDAQDRLIACNSAYRTLAGGDAKAIRLGMSRSEVFRSGLEQGLYGPVGPDALEARITAYVTALDAGVPSDLSVAGNRYLMVRQTVSNTGDRVVVLSDRTVHRRQEELQRRHTEAIKSAKRIVERKALEDPLTALPNRRAFEAELARRMACCLQTTQSTDIVPLPPHTAETILVRVDLDNFKHVNDVFGHAAGDAVLCHVAHLLSSETRPGDLAARIGGDEFVLLLAAGTSLSAADSIISRFRDRLRRPYRHEGKACHLTASFGLASSSARPVDGDELLSFADTALYEAKTKGRDRSEVFTPTVHKRLLDNRRLADELRIGLERNEFEPFFQPQVDARTLEITGAEVLARWRRPDGALRSPAAFLDIAHQLRLTGEIDAMMFDKAALLVDDWQDRGICPVKLSFNVSSQRMHDDGLVERARALARGGPIIAFELLESIMIEEESQVFAYHLDALKDAGIAIEIDDFGSGRASVLGVMQAGPDALKIDQRLIQPLPQHENVQRMVRAIVEIGRALDVSITAEGVETMEHARILADLGVKTLQGYAFAPPLSATDYAEFALRHRPMAGGAVNHAG